MTKTAFRGGLLVPMALATSLFAQDPAQDLKPLPDARDPVGIAASPFDVWIATRTSLSRWHRISEGAPTWYGTGHGLPDAGLSGICWDSPSGTLRIQGFDGISYTWSESAERATASSAHLDCASRNTRQILSSNLPSLIPEAPGWLYQGGILLEPGGRHSSILQALVVDERELWLTTTNAGIWKGRWPSGRVSPMTSGLGEVCIKHAVKESDGTVWMLGCSGNIARLGTDGALQAIDPRSPQWFDLRDAIDLAPSASRGIWVATPAGVVHATSSGIVDRYTGRKAPFGGTVLAMATLRDTTWCLSEHGISASVQSAPFRPLPMSDSAGQTFRILCLAPTRSGLLVGTTNGFRQWNGSRWIRPRSLGSAESRSVKRIAAESGNGRIAWSDGTIVRVDTLDGGHGSPGAWIPPTSELYDFAWDEQGRLHIAHGVWTIWNPDDGSERTWTIPVRAEIVVPDIPWTFLAGTTGGLQARTSAWAP